MSDDPLIREMKRRIDATFEERCAIHDEDIARYRDRMTRQEVATLLNVPVAMVANLQLKRYTPFENTSQGFREVVRYQLPELREYLWRLNPTFQSYSPLEGPLLTPEQVVALAKENGRQVSKRKLAEYRKHGGGPEFVSFGARIHRYRHRGVIAWLEGRNTIAVSDLIMRGTS